MNNIVKTLIVLSIIGIVSLTIYNDIEEEKEDLEYKKKKRRNA